MSIISGELFFAFFFLSLKNDFSFSTIIVSVSRLLIYILPWHLDLNFIGIGRISLSVVRDQRRSNNESFQHYSSPNESEIISKTLLSAAERLSFKLQLLSGKQQRRHLFDHFLSLLGHDHSCPARKYTYIEWIYDQTAATAGKVDGWAVSRVIQRCLKVEFYFVFIIFIHLFMPLQWLYVYSKAIWSLEERKADCLVAKVKWNIFFLPLISRQ